MRQGEHFFLQLLYKLFFTLIFFILSFSLHAQENCTNGIDDDRDGLIDLNDPSCQCKLHPPYNLLQNPSFENYTDCPMYRYNEDVNIIDFWRLGTVYPNIYF